MAPPPLSPGSRLDILRIRYMTRNPLLKRKAGKRAASDAFEINSGPIRALSRHGDCGSPGQHMFNLRRFRVPAAGLPLLAVVFLASGSSVLAQAAPDPQVVVPDPKAAGGDPQGSTDSLGLT